MDFRGFFDTKISSCKSYVFSSETKYSSIFHISYLNVLIKMLLELFEEIKAIPQL